MASKGTGRAQGRDARAPQDRTTRGEDPAYEASYELTSLMSSQIVSLLDPSGARNPLYIALAVVLAALVLYGFTGSRGSFDPVILVGGFIAIVLLLLAGRWRGVLQRRVRRQGLDAHDLEQDGRRWTVDVWSDRMEVTRPDGEMIVYPMGDVRSIACDPSMLLVTMREGALVAIPRKALSESRFLGCRQLIEEATGKKARV